jgi:hypothetical protein
MQEYIPDFVNKKEEVVAILPNTDEAVGKLSDLLNQERKVMQDIFKASIEAHDKSNAYMTTLLLLLCKQLESVYGIKIEFEALMIQAENYVNANWDRLKTIAVDAQTTDKQLEEIFKGLDKNDPQDTKPA